MNDKELEKTLELLGLCKDHHAFRFDDLIVTGEKVAIVKEYVKLRPSMKFRIWLISTGLGVKEED